jgi:type II secretory pathway predicted ATPase ExeA
MFKFRRGGARNDEPAPARIPRERTGDILKADEPVASIGGDQLGRRSFVTALAADIRQTPSEAGFVIGLIGAWGSGKTSILKMLEAELVEDDVTAVVHFNPWLFSGTEQLVEHFFTELSGQLESSAARNVKRVAKALRGYGAVVSTLRYLPMVGEFARVSGEIATSAGTALAGDEKTTARFRAEQLREQLQALERPVVILVDDLDRLRPEEIVDVVRLVRLVGDFPNLVYVLAFDRPVVEAALGESRTDGRRYLEKIIHLSHDLPPIRSEDIAGMLRSAIGRALPYGSSYRYDDARQNTVFWGEVWPMFTTVRDVRRFENVFANTLRLVGDEVDVTDLLALEAVRLLEPELFEALVANRGLLTGGPSPLEAGLSELYAPDNEAAATKLEQILELPSRQLDTKQLLKQLFPQCERHLGGSTYSDDMVSSWRVQRRVADGEVFSTYLYRRLAPGALPAPEVEQVVRALGDEARLTAIFDGLDDQELQSLLDRLVHYEAQFTAAMAGPAINVILAQEGRLGSRSRRFEGPGGSLLIYRLLRGLGPAEVMAALGAVSFPTLSSRYDLIRMVSHRGDDGGRMVEEKDAKQLEEDLADDVLAASSEQLVEEVDVGPLIALAGQQRASVLARELPRWTRDDRFFVRLLTSKSITSFTGSSGEGRVQLLWPRVVEEFGADPLRTRLEGIERDWVVAQGFDAETLALWDQALHYLDDPEAGERDAAPYMRI